jgi:hypothetical protein
MARKYLIPFLLFAFANLIFGMYAGLGRMGWTITFREGYLHHGAIMVGGFLGTLIALEKIIPLKKRSLLVIPLLSGISIFFLWAGSFLVGVSLLLLASAGLIIVYIIYLNRQQDLYMWIMLFSAVFLFTGNAVLLSKKFYPIALPWWMAFVLFTIVSERLELSKFLPVTKKQKLALVLFAALFVVGVLMPFHSIGNYISGLALILVGTWLMKFDVIRINLRKSGLTKFSGVSLLAGYIALVFTGVFLIALPNVALAYDATVHTFFLGFVITMIFAHGPIILPGVLGLSVKPFHPALYAPLSLLLFSLLVRISADLNIISINFQLVSGYLSGVSILLYFFTLIFVTIRLLRHAKAV